MLYDSSNGFSIKEYLSSKPFWFWILICLLIIVGFGIGFFGLYELVSTNDQEIVSSNDIENQVCEQKADFGQVTIYISGAINNSGVYVLNSGDRVIDLLEAAGGLSNRTDKVYINKQINLAKRLNDGDQIYIPTIDEVQKQIEADFSLSVNSEQNENILNNQRLISINSSTKSELMELSGIGEVRASKIIENRPYESLQKLLENNIVSETIFNEILEKISL